MKASRSKSSSRSRYHTGFNRERLHRIVPPGIHVQRQPTISPTTIALATPAVRDAANPIRAGTYERSRGY